MFLSMTRQFDIEVDLNGWLVPMHIEQKGKGVFKVVYEDTILGYLQQHGLFKWSALTDLVTPSLLNQQTTEKIGKAIINH